MFTKLKKCDIIKIKKEKNKLLDEPDYGEIYINQICGNNDWYNICTNYRLSEKFMDEFEKCLNWEAVSINQRMGSDFIYKNIDKLNLDYLLFYQRGMPWDLKNKIEQIINQRKCETYKNIYQ